MKEVNEVKNGKKVAYGNYQFVRDFMSKSGYERLAKQVEQDKELLEIIDAELKRRN